MCTFKNNNYIAKKTFGLEINNTNRLHDEIVDEEYITRPIDNQMKNIIEKYAKLDDKNKGLANKNQINEDQLDK